MEHVSRATRALVRAEGCASGADAVLLDAPCSGAGTLRRNPEHRFREADVAVRASQCELQRRLLDSAASCVRVGGTLTYSVCSPLMAETDAVVAAFLRTRSDFEIVQLPAARSHEVLRPFIADSAALGPASVVRTWTHRHPADSHFAAQVRRVR